MECYSVIKKNTFESGAQQGTDNQLPPLPVIYSFNKHLVEYDVPDTVL